MMFHSSRHYFQPLIIVFQPTGFSGSLTSLCLVAFHVLHIVPILGLVLASIAIATGVGSPGPSVILILINIKLKKL